MGSRESDAELVSAAARGDGDALAGLLARLGPSIRRWVRRAGVPERDADDVAQATAVLIWRHAGSYDPARAAVPTWAHRIAVNAARDHFRRANARFRRASGRVASLDAIPVNLRPVAPCNRDRGAVGREDLRRRIDGLPGRFREIAEHMLRGTNLRGVAAATGLPVGTVKSRGNRARALIADRPPHPNPRSTR